MTGDMNSEEFRVARNAIIDARRPRHAPDGSVHDGRCNTDHNGGECSWPRPMPRGFDPEAVYAVLRADHGPQCHEGDEDAPGSCVCGKAELARALAEAAEVEGRYDP